MMNSDRKKYDKLKEALNDITDNLRLLQFYPPHLVAIRGTLLYICILLLLIQPAIALSHNWSRWNFDSRVSTIDNLTYSLGMLCLSTDLFLMPHKTKILLDIINSEFSVYHEEIRSYKRTVYEQKCQLVREMTQQGYKMAKIITTVLKYFFAVHVTIPIYGICFYYIKSEDVQKLPLLIRMYSPLTFSLEMQSIEEYLIMSVLQLGYMYISVIFVIILLQMQIVSIFHIRVEMKLFHMSVKLINGYCKQMTLNADGRMNQVYESELRFMIGELARHHQNIFKEVKDVNIGFKFRLFYFNAYFCLQFCLGIFIFLKGQALLKLKYGIILVTLITIAFLFSEDGQNFQDEGEELRITLYNCNWQNKPKWLTSTLHILMTRNNSLPKIALFNVFTLNRNNLTVVIRGAYSYFSLLNHFSK